MGEIRIVGPGKTPGYPYPVCKKTRVNYMYTKQNIFIFIKVYTKINASQKTKNTLIILFIVKHYSDMLKYLRFFFYSEQLPFEGSNSAIYIFASLHNVEQL